MVRLHPGRRGLRQDGRRRRGGGARRGQRNAGRADGADRAARRAALAQLPPVVPAAESARGAAFPARSRRATRTSALEAIASGEVRIVVGTHALFQEGIEFAKLALIIVDEQHRFGVQQRLRLQEKGRKQGRFPHQLIMTATPIPRTLAMTAYADLDISVIDELPPGRTPVKTVVVPEAAARRGRRAHRSPRAATGRQVYWVCPLIEESDELRSQAAEETAAALAEALPEVRVGIVHGRMPAAKKDQAMLAFKAGQDPAAGRHHRHRSGRGRAERHADGHRERRAHGPRAAAPAARPRRPRRRGQHLRAALSQPAVASSRASASR